jgi:hypothetical protein
LKAEAELRAAESQVSAQHVIDLMSQPADSKDVSLRKKQATEETASEHVWHMVLSVVFMCSAPFAAP